jgi:anhydro-N-acetylmuramic acid kinase
VTSKRYYVGLMSGTSADSIDAVVAHIEGDSIDLVATLGTPFDNELRSEIFALTRSGDRELARMGLLDGQLGELFAQAALNVIRKAGLSPSQIAAIGSHGQTLRHAPNAAYPYTLQIGDPSRIAERTGITTVADFRRRDMAAGGQGAPLVPAFHAAAFAKPHTSTAVVNIGGIANVSLIDAAGQVSGFDTGPGNTLMDHWIGMCWGDRFDRDGAWAATGQVDEALLAQMLADPYFAKPAPKSTGVDYFNAQWLDQFIHEKRQPEQFIQRTLLELTARTIADALVDQQPETIAICGGGASNVALMQRLGTLLKPSHVTTTEALGIHPDWVEATAFAWLAKRTLASQPGNEPRVTGAKGYRVLGAVYPAG